VPDEPSTKPLLDKLGVKPGSRVSLLGVGEPWFVELLRERGADVSTRRRKDSDLLFVAVERRPDLAKLAELEPWMTRNGAAWVVFPRGRKDLRDVDVIGTGVAAGLVDNKVVRFSDTHTTMRFVIPLARR
jgi:hypothetical protein